MQKAEYEKLKSSSQQKQQPHRDRSDQSHEMNDLDLLDLKNHEGKTFKEKVFKKQNTFTYYFILLYNFLFVGILKVKEVLTPEEKYRLKKLLLDYNTKKYRVFFSF